MRPLFCLAGLLCSLTLRAQTCEANLTSSGSQKDGLIFASSVSFSGLSSHSAIGQIKAIVASDPAFELGADSYQSNQGTLEVVQKATSKSREFPVYFTANDQGQVTFKAVFPAGMGVKAADIGSYACGKWLDRLQTAGRGGTGAAEGAQLSRTVVPTAIEPSVAADGSRTAVPEKPLNVLRPGSTFDAAAAKAALEPGNSIIRGTACIRRAGNLILARNQHVYLYPSTPYLKEAMQLPAKAKRGIDRVEIDPAVIAARMDGMTNAKGQFQFSRMKPGEYYLITTMQSAISGVQDISSGGSYTGPNEITFFHTLVPYTNHYGDILDKYVNVKSDGSTLR